MKVLIADNIGQAGIEYLEDIPEIEVDVRTGLSEEELASEIASYEGIIVRSATRLTGKVLARADKLRFIVRAGVGIDNVDLTAAAEKSITVMNTPGANATSAVEHTFALLLALCRHIVPADGSVREGKWERKRFMGTQLAGKTLGIIGLGRVGREVARRAIAFDMKVLGYDPYRSALRLSTGFDPSQVELEHVELGNDLKAILASADFLTVHVPLTEETRGLIAEDEFALMKDGVRIINCARGGIISEKALSKALSSGKVAGAALDVFEKEPPGDSPLLEFEQVVLTPHLGASTHEAQEAVALQAARQLADALTGRGTVNVVKPAD